MASWKQTGTVVIVHKAALAINLLVPAAIFPCIWGAFISAKAIVWLGLAWLFCASILTGLESVVLIAILQPPPFVRYAIFMIAWPLNASQAATVFGTLLIYRALGFRLARARPTNAADTPSSA